METQEDVASGYGKIILPLPFLLKEEMIVDLKQLSLIKIIVLELL